MRMPTAVTLQQIALFSILAAGTTSMARAQSWTVGEPVDMLLYSQPFYGGCDPEPAYAFTMAPSTVSGVEYRVVVVSTTPADGSVSILPGLTDGAAGDGFTIDAAVQRTVFIPEGTSSAVLAFRAMGTPTQAGQVQPCSTSQYWMSNMMMCPEGLIPVIDSDCSVQVSTGVEAAAAPGQRVQWPSAANGQHLVLDVPGSAVARIVDLNGRVAMEQPVSGHASMDLSRFAEGIYLLHLAQASGAGTTERFVIAAR